MRGDGLVTYTPNTMNMTGRDFFYSCAEIVGDPTYTTNYYQYERAVFIPATTIYYEDNFGADISFIDEDASDYEKESRKNNLRIEKAKEQVEATIKEEGEKESLPKKSH